MENYEFHVQSEPIESYINEPVTLFFSFRQK